MKHKQNGKGFSLRLGLLGIVAGCWILPMALVLSSFAYSNAVSVRRQFDSTLRASVANAALLCRRGIRDSVVSSRDASYDRQIRTDYLAYLGDGDRQKLYNSVNAYLQDKYRYDDNYRATAVFFTSEPGTLYYTFNPRIGAAYSDVQDYSLHAHGTVRELSRELGTRIAFVRAGDGMYMVRNIVDSTFTPYAAIVSKLNDELITGSFSGVLWSTGVTVYLNGASLTNDVQNPAGTPFPPELSLAPGEFTVTEHGGKTRVFGRETTDGVEILYAVEVDMQAFLNQSLSFTNVIYVLLALAVPLILLAIGFFYRNIFRPVDDLSLAAGKIQGGELGYEVQRHTGNREFRYLTETFNGMSVRLRHQFERIYSEELALRDARIMALQSQINPHFLNNTLEIINWEVRLGNNDGVSRLIEALSIMLDAAMDRRNAPLIPLRQELQYVDSYLYIVSERFGSRLRVHMDVDPEALGCQVPRLIMQPIIENAVEHGVDKMEQGEISITAAVVGDSVTLSVENNSALSDADADVVARLLSPEYGAKGEGSLHLGIRNVNMRLKMIYGESVGLSIQGGGESTVASFTVPLYSEYDLNANLHTNPQHLESKMGNNMQQEPNR